MRVDIERFCGDSGVVRVGEVSLPERISPDRVIPGHIAQPPLVCTLHASGIAWILKEFAE